MAWGASLSLISIEYDKNLVLSAESWETGVVAAGRLTDVLQEPEGLLVLHKVGTLGPDELHVVLPLEHFCIVHHTMTKVDELGMLPGYSRETFVVVTEHNNPVILQKFLIRAGGVTDTDLVIHQLRWQVGTLVDIYKCW